jgi:DNA invertase Pin-like site-specific DNA recombinase
MRVGYARVSTGEQTLDMQIDALEDEGCEKIYSEKISGAAKERPKLQECMEHLREGDTLVVWKLDRLGRSMQDLVEKVESLGDRGIDFVSLQQDIDTTSAQGKLVFHLMAAMAEFERNITRERTMAGLKAAKERGKTGGRPSALSEEDITQIQALMRDDEVSTKDICDRFDIGTSTLYRHVGPDGERRSGDN